MYSEGYAGKILRINLSWGTLTSKGAVVISWRPLALLGGCHQL